MRRYLIARRLAAAAGVLESFIGLDVETRRPVVAKRLVAPWGRQAATFAARFRAHLDASAGVAGLVPVLELGVARDTVWVVHELVEAESLRHVVNALAQKRGLISPAEGMGVVGHLASLLRAMHGREEPLVHGDVCASTVMLLPHGEVRLIDGGITTALEPSAAIGPARAEPYSVAPEQLTGLATAASDVFRLGLLLHELALGKPLFYAPEPLQAMVFCQRFIGLDPDDIAQVPQPWRSLMVNMLAVEPGDRPTSAEVDDALASAAKEAGWPDAGPQIAELFTRALGVRPSLAALAEGGTQELVLEPLQAFPGEVPSIAQGVEAPTGSFSALPSAHRTPPPPRSSPPLPPPPRRCRCRGPPRARGCPATPAWASCSSRRST